MLVCNSLCVKTLSRFDLKMSLGDRIVRLWIIVSGALCVAWPPPPAQAFVLLQDEYFPRAHFSERWLNKSPAFLHAQMLSSVGLDTVEALINAQKERRVFAALGAAARTSFTAGEKLRLDLQSSALRTTATTEFEENSNWKKIESASEWAASGSVRYLLKEGFRLGGGASWILRPASLETFEFSNQTARSEFSAYSLLAPEYVLSKDSGSGWSAGLAWRPKVSKSRGFKRAAGAEVVEFEEDVVLDEQWSAGLTTQLQGSRQLTMDVNLHGVGEGQQRDLKTGTTNDDGSRRRYELSSLLSLGEGGVHKLAVGVGYQSMGYTDQGNVAPQTIPLWTLLLRDELKWNELNARIDSLLGYGSDKQSLPDLNANYRRVLLSVQMGIVF